MEPRISSRLGRIKKAIRTDPYGFQYGEGLSDETAGFEVVAQFEQEKEQSRERGIEYQGQQHELELEHPESHQSKRTQSLHSHSR